MIKYHGIIIKEGLLDETLLNKIKVIGSKKDGIIFRRFTLLKLEIEKRSLSEIINIVQKNLKTNPVYYAHFYRDKELIVIFPKKTFQITTDKSSWKKVINYGKSVGIPEKELDFYPCRIEDETY